MSRLKQLLVETDFTLERIAESCGFAQPEYMSVLFKRLSGLTPGEYRRQHGDVAAKNHLRSMAKVTSSSARRPDGQ